ncbi:MAG: PRC-barrel domain-containing protein [Paracoccaceae bacterium]|jgi:sporulation protein YlmC with PRC-barrel domain
MKNLMLTTALVAVTSMGAVAQTADAPAPTPTANANAEAGATSQAVPAFVASDFEDKELYTLNTDEARALRETRSADGERVGWESSTIFTENRDGWENVGNISDIVITQDGDVQGVLIDVGGFLGLGARTVMIDMSELYFVTNEADAEGEDRYSVLVSLSKEQLEALPAWDEAQLTSGFAASSPAMMQEQTPTQTAGDTTAAEGGFAPMPEQARTAERLTGANAYTPEGEDIATVSELVLDEDGSTSHLIMDVGGFLGMGSHTVALDIAEVDILWNDAEDEVRVEVPLSEEELRALPAYQKG